MTPLLVVSLVLNIFLIAGLFAALDVMRKACLKEPTESALAQWARENPYEKEGAAE